MVNHELTPAEINTIMQFAFGQNGVKNKDIADRMGINHRTVEAHLSAAMSKLRLSNRTQLMVWAHKNLKTIA